MLPSLSLPKKERDWKMAQHTATKLNKTGRLPIKSVADGISTCLLVLCSGHKQIDFNRIPGYRHILFWFPNNPTSRCALVQCPRRKVNTEMSPAAKFPVVLNFISSTTPPNVASWGMDNRYQAKLPTPTLSQASETSASTWSTSRTC